MKTADDIRAGKLAKKIRRGTATKDEQAEFARLDFRPVAGIDARSVFDLPVAEAMWKADAADRGA